MGLRSVHVSLNQKNKYSSQKFSFFAIGDKFDERAKFFGI